MAFVSFVATLVSVFFVVEDAMNAGITRAKLKPSRPALTDHPYQQCGRLRICRNSRGRLKPAPTTAEGVALERST